MEPNKYEVDFPDLMRHRNSRLPVALSPLTMMTRNASATESRSHRLFMAGQSDARMPALQAGAGSGNLGATRRLMRWLKFCVAILLLPACVAGTITAWQFAHALLAGTPTGSALAFGAGYGAWLLVF